MRGTPLRRTARRTALGVAVLAMGAAVLAAPATPPGHDEAGASGATGKRDSTAEPSRTGDPRQASSRRADSRPAAARVNRSVQRPALQRARRAEDEEEVTSGLQVTIEQLTPAIRPGRPVQISGTVTNLDEHRWFDLQASLVVDPVTIGTDERLADVLASPADTYSGERILEAGFYDADIEPVAPGESATYSLSVPYRLLGLSGAASGAYTVSVHVLGERADQGARLDGVDGRARTVMPYLDADDEPVGMSVVLPLHHELHRLPDGTYEEHDALVEAISPGGVLRNRLDLAGTGEPGQVTLLVDPALLDALRTVASGRFEPPTTTVLPEDGQPEAEEDGGQAPTPTDEQVAATEFLDRLEQAVDRSRVVVEPYGRADLTSLRTFPGTRLLRTIQQVDRRALEETSIGGDPVTRPAGQLDPTVLAQVARHRTVLVGSDQVSGWTPSDGAAARLRGEDGTVVPVVVADSTLSDGGPAPGPADTALQVRQRLLAEAAVISVGADDERKALVFVPDDDWDPGQGVAASRLLDGLQTPWTVAVGVSTAASANSSTRARPAAETMADPPLPSYVLEAAQVLRRRATTLQAVSGGTESGLLPYYQQAAALTVSSDRRDEPAVAADVAEETAAGIDALLSRIHVEVPEYVTLSSDSGRFPVTLTNRLDRPVTVGAVLSDAEGLIEVGDIAPRTIAPRTQVTVTLSVSAPEVGVTNVRARLVTAGGRPFGEAVDFPLRSSMVGVVIWYAMGAIGVFLLLLVVRRIGRRLRGGGPEPDADTDSGADSVAGAAP